MPPHSNNPLLDTSGPLGRQHAGSEMAGIQLQDHCDRLNALKGDKYWFVAGTAPARFITNGPRQDNAGRTPYATPDEVSDIMRKFGVR